VLEKEAQIPPIDLHLDKMLLLHEGKQLDTPIKSIAKKARERIGGRLNHLKTKLLKKKCLRNTLTSRRQPEQGKRNSGPRDGSDGRTTRPGALKGPRHPGDGRSRSRRSSSLDINERPNIKHPLHIIDKERNHNSHTGSE
jgi:hypothetical protein